MLSLVDFTEKVVLDVGSGTGMGRLASVTTPEAKVVYAIEPVENLRSYIRFKAERLNIHNLYVVDGLITRTSFEDGFADVSMSGHVYGDRPREENSDMERVTKRGGMVN